MAPEMFVLCSQIRKCAKKETNKKKKKKKNKTKTFPLQHLLPCKMHLKFFKMKNFLLGLIALPNLHKLVLRYGGKQWRVLSAN